ncbi:hypothetical protein D3C86_1188640 [compost metagenome]
MITPITPLETLLALDLDDGLLECIEEQAWKALDGAQDYDRDSFIIGYRSGSLAAQGSLREQLVYGG